MTLDKLKRVIWRLTEMKPNEHGLYTRKQIRRAIFEEIGLDERTVRKTIRLLRELGWIKGKLMVGLEVKKDVEI